MTNVPMKLRAMVHEDRHLILSAWIHSFYRSSSTPMQFISHNTFTVLYGPVLDKILSRSQVLVAVAPEDPSLIIGWVCFEKDAGVVHYVWCRDPYRRQGVASEMLRCLDVKAYSHETHVWRKYVLHRYPDWRYKPELARLICIEVCP